MEHRSLGMATLGLIGGACLAATVAACSSPNRPSVSVASAQPVSPANATQVSYYSQPVALVVANGVATGGASPTATLEIATDSAFAAVVITKVIPPSANGQSTVTLDHLNAATTYYWRVKTAASNNPGTVTSPETFSIGPQLVIQPPAPAQPLANAVTPTRPTFSVMDATHTGPAATLRYRFDVATDATFSAIVATGTVPEVATQTSFTPSSDLASGMPYYWRTQASDTATGVSSGYSSPRSFRTTFVVSGGAFTLEVRPPPGCIGHLFASDYLFDGSLQTLGNRLKWVAANNSYRPSAPLTLDVTLSGEHVAGGIEGGFSDDTTGAHHVRFNKSYWPVVAPVAPATVAGDLNANNAMVGTIDGALVEHAGNYSIDNVCEAKHTWTLAPH